MSQLLVRLERELATATNPEIRAQLSAEIACNLARLGRVKDAKDCVLELRRVFGEGQSPQVSLWIMLAEGLIYFYEEFNPLALDRIARAQVLGLALRYKKFAALVSAWKAHIEFEISDLDSMRKSLATAIEHVEANDHDAMARIAIVLSNTSMLCGKREEAQRWFLRGRDHAIKNGDQASIEALLYNRAGYHFALLRVEQCLGAPTAEEIKIVRMEMDSATNLQILTKNAAMASQIPLCDARLLIIERKYGRAMAKLIDLKNGQNFPGYNFDISILDLEICFCRFHLGGVAAARVAFKPLNADLTRLHLDEQMVAAWMQWQLSLSDTVFGDAELLQAHFHHLRDAHQNFQIALAQNIAEFVNTD